MDFDNALQDTVDSIKIPLLNSKDFGKILDAIYRAYNIGQAKAWTEALEHTSQAAAMMTISQQSHLSRLTA